MRYCNPKRSAGRPAFANTATKWYWCRLTSTPRYLALAAILAFASRSAWSLYSPCGPCGRGCTNTSICGTELSLNAGSFCRYVSKPRLFNSLIRCSAKFRLISSFVDIMLTPRSNGFMGSPNFPAERIAIISPGGCTTTPVSFIASAKSTAKASASASPARVQKLAPSEFGGNFPNADARSDFSLLLNRRQATLASISTRAVCSSSASFFNFSESFRSCAASSSSLADADFSAAIVSSAADCCLSSTMNVRVSKINSPAIPATTRIIPVEWRTSFFNTQRSNDVLRKAITLAVSNPICFSFGHSSSTAPPISVSVEQAAAISRKLALFQMSERDHRIARMAATIKIYMLLCALIGVPLATLILGFVEIIRQNKHRIKAK